MQIIAVVLVVVALVIGIRFCGPQFGGDGDGKGTGTSTNIEQPVNTPVEIFIEGDKFKHNGEHLRIEQVVSVAKDRGMGVIILYDDKSEQATFDLLVKTLKENEIAFEKKSQ